MSLLRFKETKIKRSFIEHRVLHDFKLLTCHVSRLHFPSYADIKSYHIAQLEH